MQSLQSSADSSVPILGSQSNVTLKNSTLPITGINNSSSKSKHDESFVCTDCNVVMESSKLCVAHMETVHDVNFNLETSIICGTRDSVPRRKIKLPWKYTLNAGCLVPTRFQMVSNTNLHRCNFCPAKFEFLEVREFHQDSHWTGDGRQRGFACRMCESSLPPQRDSVDSSSANGLELSVIDFPIFPRWSELSWHLWKKHKIDCELQTCSHPGCEYKACFPQKLREHEAIHREKKAFDCSICHKSFPQLKQLRTHEKYHIQKKTELPPPNDSRWYTTKECPICNRVLSDAKCLKKHIAAVHNKLKPHICNICGHGSARKAELQLHMRQHTGEKPFKCDVCGFSTRDHNSLRRHLLTHGDSRPYQCPLCSFQCIHSGGFKRHVIAKHHDAEAPGIHLCPYCAFISVNFKIFINHLNDHNDGRLPIPEGNGDFKGSQPCVNETSDGQTNDEAASIGELSNAKRLPWTGDDDSSHEVIDTGGITIPATDTDNSLLVQPT